MKKNMRQIIKYFCTYLYLILGYSFFIFYLSYRIRITNKLEGWLVLLIFLLLCFIVYTAINHIVIKRVISNKMLIVIEAMLFLSMFILVISDFRYEEFRHLQYIERTKPIRAIPYNEL